MIHTDGGKSPASKKMIEEGFIDDIEICIQMLKNILDLLIWKILESTNFIIKMTS